MISRPPSETHRQDLDKVLRVLQDTPAIDREYMAPLKNSRRVFKAPTGIAATRPHRRPGFFRRALCRRRPLPRWKHKFSIEQVAGIIGPNGFHVVAGLEGGYVAEQLAGRAGATVHKVELLQLADEKYPIRAERLEDVIQAAAGKDVDHIALLTPRQVIPQAWSNTSKTCMGKTA